MAFRKKKEKTLTPIQRRHVFEIARDMICAKNTDKAEELIADSILAKRVSVDDTTKWIANMTNDISLYPDRKAYNDVAELIVFHNLIDYTLGGPLGDKFVMICSDGRRVYIYCPENNILVDFTFASAAHLTDLATHFMIAFTIIYGGMVELGG